MNEMSQKEFCNNKKKGGKNEMREEEKSFNVPVFKHNR